MEDAFELAVIELLGPAALTGGKLTAYEIAKMFWNAALANAQPTPAQIETYALNVAEKVRLACYKHGAENVSMTDIVKLVKKL